MGQALSPELPRVSASAAQGPAHVLIIEATSPAGGVPILPEGVGELLIQGISEAAGDALPGQDEDDDHGVLAVVARPVPHQAQQLLLQCVPADYLQGWGAGRAPLTTESQAPVLLCTGCRTRLPAADHTGRGGGAAAL